MERSKPYFPELICEVAIEATQTLRPNHCLCFFDVLVIHQPRSPFSLISSLLLSTMEVLRILAFQLTSMELAWWVQQHQLHCDRFLCANAQLAPTSDAEHAQLAPWRQRYAELEEAERLRRQALRLNSEVGRG